MSQIPYEKNLDGIRTFSLLCVMLFHLDVPFLTGGYVAVDLFFMVSGYLISRILRYQFLKTGRINLKEFWRRRTKRLFPLAIFALPLTFIFTLAVGGPRLAVGYFSDFLAAATYVFNWHLYTLSIDYLNTGIKSPVLHYWTLAVEEQFYIFWPLLFWLVAKVFQFKKEESELSRDRGLFWAILGVVTISFVWCYFHTKFDQSFAFFSSFTRAWEFGLGGIAGVISFRFKKPLLATFVSFLGAAIILVSIFVIDQKMAFPGAVALVPTGGLFLILLSIESAWYLPRVLSSKFCAHLGQLSYGMYLFHWPFMFLLKGKIFPNSKFLEGSLFIALTYLCAITTFYLIENPFRFSKTFYYKGRDVIVWSLVGLFLNIGLFYSVRMLTPEIIYTPNGTAFPIAEIRDDLPVTYGDKCHFKKSGVDLKDCVYGDKEGQKMIYLFGDSVAAQWFPGLNQLAKKKKWKLISRTKSACPYFNMNVYDYSLKRRYTECEKWRESVYKEIGELKPDILFLSASSRYKPFDSYNKPMKGRVIERVSQSQLDAHEKLLGVGLGKIVLIKGTPTFSYDPVRCQFLNSWDCSERRETSVVRPRFPIAKEHLFKEAHFLDPLDELCDSKRCFARTNESIIMRDYQHITASFAGKLSGLFSGFFKDE